MNKQFSVEEFLRSHDYLVKVSLVENLYLWVNYLGSLHTEYILYDDEHSGIICKNITNDIDEAIDLPRAAIRLYILCDIYRQCKILGISNDIVSFYDVEGNQTTLVDLLPLNLDENEIKAERLLQKYVEKCYKGTEDESMLEKQGLLRSALLLRGLIK